MKSISVSSLAFVAAACVAALVGCSARHTPGEASPIYGVTVPDGYRQWQVVAPSQEEGSLGELRVILGNDVAMKAFREGKIPFPDGTILAKVAWKRVQSSVDDRALGHFQAFVPGRPTTIQFMVKDSSRYASTGGWGFGRFDASDSKPHNIAEHRTCFACHSAFVSDHDFVFTRYAP
ncbi:MAG: cytochrome P460 family protein [Candidatus Cybelea sp.]|jgi:hypothetical protein